MIEEKEEIRQGVATAFFNVESTVLSQGDYESKQREYIRASGSREGLRSGFQTFVSDVSAIRRLNSAVETEDKKKRKPLDDAQRARLQAIARKTHNQLVTDQGQQMERQPDLRFQVDDRYSPRVMQTWTDMHAAMNAARILSSDPRTRDEIIYKETRKGRLQNEEIDAATELNIAVFKVAVNMYERFKMTDKVGNPDRAALLREIHGTMQELARQMARQTGLPLPFYESIITSMSAQFSAYVSLREEGWDIRLPTPSEDRRGMDFIATRILPDGTTERLIVDVKSGNQDEERIMIEPPPRHVLTKGEKQKQKADQKRLLRTILLRDIDDEIDTLVDSGTLEERHRYAAGKLMETTTLEREENPEKNGIIRAMIVVIRPNQFLLQNNGNN